MNNIELFNTVVGLVLSDLYREFPSPLTFDSIDTARRANLDIPKDFSGELICAMTPVKSSIHWLIEEGYIRCGHQGTNTDFRFRDCVLTSKGIQVLSFPSSLEAKQTVGDKIMEAAKSGALDTIRDGVKTVIMEGGKTFVRAAFEGIVQGMKS